MRKLEDVIEVLKKLDEMQKEANAKEDAKEESKETPRIVVEFGDKSDDVGCVALHLEDVSTFEVAVGTAALLSSLLDKCKNGKEDELILLVLLLAKKLSSDTDKFLAEEE